MANHLVLEAQFNQFRELTGPLNKVLLNIILLEIDEGWVFVPVLGQKVEAVDFIIAMKQAADLPCNALCKHTFANPNPVENLQCALCPTDGTRSD